MTKSVMNFAAEKKKYGKFHFAQWSKLKVIFLISEIFLQLFYKNIFCIDDKNESLMWSQNKSFYMNWYNTWLIGLVGRVFANDPEDLGSIPIRVIPKTLKKWNLIPPCLTLSNTYEG